MKKLYLLTGIIFTLIFQPVFATERSLEWIMNGSSHFCSKYVFNGILLCDRPVIQSDFTLTSPAGVSFSVWWSTDLQSEKSYGDEIDYVVSYNIPLDNYDLTLSASYFDCFRLLNNQEDSFEFKCLLTRDWKISDSQTLTPFVELKYYIPVGDTCGGLVSEVGMRHNIQVFENLCLVQQLSLLHDTGAFSTDSGFIAKYKAGVRAKINNYWSFDIGGEYYCMLSPFTTDSRGTDGNQLVGFAGFSFAW